MANEKLHGSKRLIGVVYRSELVRELMEIDHRIEKTHADGRFEIAGVSHKMIEAAMAKHGLGGPAENQHLVQHAALMTRAHKCDVDKDALRESWAKQAAGLGFDVRALGAQATQRDAGKESGRDTVSHFGDRQGSGRAARADRAATHLFKREAVF